MIRNVERKDITDLINLLRDKRIEQYTFSFGLVIQNLIIQMDSLRNNDIWLVYEVDNIVVATLQVRQNRNVFKKHIFYISTIAVSPIYQSCGIGKELMDHMIQILPENSKIELSVIESNKKAILFYEKLGFQRSGFINKSLYKDGVYYNEYSYEYFKGEH